jgi:hypothetical protein
MGNDIMIWILIATAASIGFCAHLIWPRPLPAIYCYVESQKLDNFPDRYDNRNYAVWGMWQAQ